jgi:hypothetical protein
MINIDLKNRLDSIGSEERADELLNLDDSSLTTYLDTLSDKDRKATLLDIIDWCEDDKLREKTILKKYHKDMEVIMVDINNQKTEPLDDDGELLLIREQETGVEIGEPLYTTPEQKKLLFDTMDNVFQGTDFSVTLVGDWETGTVDYDTPNCTYPIPVEDFNDNLVRTTSGMLIDDKSHAIVVSLYEKIRYTLNL